MSIYKDRVSLTAHPNTDVILEGMEPGKCSKRRGNVYVASNHKFTLKNDVYVTVCAGIIKGTQRST